LAAERRVPPFLVLLAGPEAGAVARRLASSAPPGALRVLIPPPEVAGDLDGNAGLDRWWQTKGAPGVRPVVLIRHSEGLPAALPALDGSFVVSVPDGDKLGAYAGLANARACLEGDVDALARAALAWAGIRPPEPPVDPFALLARLSEPGPAPAPPPPAHTSGRDRVRRPAPGLGQAVLARKPLIVAVVSRKGGVGKTASAAALAAMLGECLDVFGHTAALVDGNIGNPDAWGRLEVDGAPPTVREIVAGLMSGREPPSPAWSRTPALAVYPESREAGDGYTPAHVERLAFYLRARHAAIVVDLPNRLPALGSGEAALAAAWISLAGVVVIPTTADPSALLGAEEYLDVESLRGKPAVVPYIVPRLREIRDAPQVREALDRIARRAAVVRVPDDDRATLALIRRQSITEVGGGLRRAYLALATEVVGAAARVAGSGAPCAA
jgi:MinD-like ATPase involved in chromosome partitioning or flagellar assembly